MGRLIVDEEPENEELEEDGQLEEVEEHEESEDDGSDSDGEENDESEDADEDDEEESTDKGEGEDDEDGELLVAIDGEEPEREAPAPKWVRKVQRNSRRLLKENEELRRQLQSSQSPGLGAVPSIDPGPEPKVDDYDYDPDAFAEAYKSWTRKSIEAEKVKLEQQRAIDEQRQQFEAIKQAYVRRKKELRASDFADAEELVQLSLDENQFNLLQATAKDPALTVYALGKNPKRLQQLAKQTVWKDFIYEVASIEGKLTMKKSKPAAPPEKRVKGRSTGTGEMDSKLERARKRAEKSGDMTEVVALRAQMGR